MTLIQDIVMDAVIETMKDIDFNDLMKDATKSIDYDAITGKILKNIARNYTPEEIFNEHDLKLWAEDKGWTEPE